VAADLHRELYEGLDALPIYDIHTHIDARNAFAGSLADIIGYHYYTELANSAEYRPDFAAEMDPDQIVRQVLERLPLFANTVQSDWLMVIGETFLGIKRSEWTSLAWQEVAAKAQKAIDAPGYRQEVLRRSGVQSIYMTNSCDEDLEGIDRRLFVPCLRVDPFVFAIDNPAERERLERASATVVRSPEDFALALRRVFNKFAAHGMAYAALSTVPNLVTRPVSDEEAAAALNQALTTGRLDEQARRAWAAYALNCVGDCCRATHKPFHLMIGVRRGAYPAGVAGGRDLMDSANSLVGYDYLFNEYWDVNFPVSVLADTSGLELAASSWIRHNVYVSGHWWYQNSPSDIARELRRRLDVVPANKLLGYYSDAYRVEFILPKFRMYKHELATVLAERVERSLTHPNMAPLDVDQALRLGKALLLDNPTRLFGAA